MDSNRVKHTHRVIINVSHLITAYYFLVCISHNVFSFSPYMFYFFTSYFKNKLHIRWHSYMDYKDERHSNEAMHMQVSITHT